MEEQPNDGSCQIVWDTEVELGGWVNKDDEEDKKK